MKSNEEFIAGIYEKAAVYKEEQNTTKKVSTSSRAIKIVAMLAVCVGLAGVGNVVWNQNKVMENTEEEHGIALLSETGKESVGPGVAFHRMGPSEDYAIFTGTVESIEEQEKLVWVKLEFTQEMQEDAMVAVRFDVLEEINEDICVGKKLMVSGVVGTYENESSDRYGLTQLTVNDLANVWLWIEETETYRNSDGEERQ